jgi:hypothetical protein
MAARASVGRLPSYVHVYFHDEDLLDRRRAAALRLSLTLLSKRRRAVDLAELAAEVAAAAPEIVYPGT